MDGGAVSGREAEAVAAIAALDDAHSEDGTRVSALYRRAYRRVLGVVSQRPRGRSIESWAMASIIFSLVAVLPLDTLIYEPHLPLLTTGWALAPGIDWGANLPGAVVGLIYAIACTLHAMWLRPQAVVDAREPRTWLDRFGRLTRAVPIVGTMFVAWRWHRHPSRAAGVDAAPAPVRHPSRAVPGWSRRAWLDTLYGTAWVLFGGIVATLMVMNWLAAWAAQIGGWAMFPVWIAFGVLHGLNMVLFDLYLQHMLRGRVRPATARVLRVLALPLTWLPLLPGMMACVGTAAASDVRRSKLFVHRTWQGADVLGRFLNRRRPDAFEYPGDVQTQLDRRQAVLQSIVRVQRVRLAGEGMLVGCLLAGWATPWLAQGGRTGLALVALLALLCLTWLTDTFIETFTPRRSAQRTPRRARMFAQAGFGLAIFLLGGLLGWRLPQPSNGSFGTLLLQSSLLAASIAGVAIMVSGLRPSRSLRLRTAFWIPIAFLVSVIFGIRELGAQQLLVPGITIDSLLLALSAALALLTPFGLARALPWVLKPRRPGDLRDPSVSWATKRRVMAMCVAVLVPLSGLVWPLWLLRSPRASGVVDA
ncbi:MAG: hypothetical protein AAF772_01425 [Acidobacteriota bacterium]